MNVAVFRHYDRAALDRQYDNALKVPDDYLKALRAHWAQDSARVREAMPCVLDVPYDPASGERLDIFGQRQSGSAPVQIYVHGGYWISNDKKDCSYVARGFVDAAFVCVVINYSLIPSVVMAEQVRQCRAAVRWVLANIAQYGGDPERVYVTGHSAGGHLSVSLLTDPELTPGRIKGVASLSGLYDLEPVRLSFVNEKLGLSAQDAATLSPLRQTPRDTTPRLLLTIGAREGEEYIRQMTDLADAWRPHIPHLVAQVLPDTDHFGMRATLDDSGSSICRLIWQTMGAGQPKSGAA
jgi:arylformamidase